MIHCSFIPFELIKGFGFTPKRFVPSGKISDESNGELHPGICSWCKSLIGEMKNNDKFHFGSCTCDQMSRALDTLKISSNCKAFLSHMPATRNKGTFELFKSELSVLTEKLEDLSGKKFDKYLLKKEIEKSNNLKKEIGKLRPHLSGSDFVSLMHSVFQNWEIPETISNKNIKKKSHPKIAIAGSPTAKEGIKLLCEIEKFPAEIVFDATCTGDRFLELEIDENIDPFEAAASAYFNQTPCIRARPNDDFFSWMNKKITDLEIDGVVWKTLRGCDLWNSEIQTAKELLSVPVLGLDYSYSDIDSHRIKTRIEAFLENL
ncbi:MAG: 2-hydroxyacyl-CoA dehydratase family protein [Caldisericia bacterium]